MEMQVVGAIAHVARYFTAIAVDHIGTAVAIPGQQETAL